MRAVVHETSASSTRSNPCAIAAPLDPLGKTGLGANFQAVLECPYVNVFPDEFEGSARGGRIELEQRVAFVVELLLPRLRIPNGSNFLHTSLV